MHLPLDRLAGLLLVVAIHAAMAYGLWSHRLMPSPMESATLFVNFIAPPAPQKAEQPRQPAPPKPRAIMTPQPHQLLVEAPVTGTDYVAPLPPKAAPVIEAPLTPLPTAPVALSGELSLVCPERTPPAYPALSLRRGESGTTVLQVELGADGRVAQATIETGSGYPRLDEAALAAVKGWRCQPPRRNGQPTAAVARQPFKFVLQEN